MENKLELKIGTPVTIVTKNGIVYNDYYYLGKGVIGRMNLPYKTDDIFYIPLCNIFKENGIKYIMPYNEFYKFIDGTKTDNDNYLKSKVIDVDDLDNCLYTKEGFDWWNDKQKEEIKSLY